MNNFKYFKGYSNVINMNIRTVEVAGEVRTIRATWTPELAQDIEALHGIDIEQELTNILSQQIAQEIDNEIIGNIFPLERRVTAATIANDLVPIQPLGLPQGQIYYFDIDYGDNILKTFKYGR